MWFHFYYKINMLSICVLISLNDECDDENLYYLNLDYICYCKDLFINLIVNYYFSTKQINVK